MREECGNADDGGRRRFTRKHESNCPQVWRRTPLIVPDLAYALKRLIRGLSSSREAARIGFAVGLTELLARLSDLPLGPVLALLLDNTEVTGSTKGEEGRDRHFPITGSRS